MEFFKANPVVATTPAHLYLITTDNFCKVGITTKSYIRQRFSGFDYTVVVDKLLPLREAYEHEQQVLEFGHQYRFRIHDLKQTNQTGWTECFPLSLAPRLKQLMDQIQ